MDWGARLATPCQCGPAALQAWTCPPGALPCTPPPTHPPTRPPTPACPLACVSADGLVVDWEDLLALEQALNANGLGVTYSTAYTMQGGVLVGGAII